MSYIKEQVAYIKGLAEGMELGHETKEAKILNAIIPLLEYMANTIDENGELIGDIQGNVEDIAGDLSSLEDVVFNMCDEDEDEDIIDEEDEMTDDYIELQCPHCGDTVFFDRTVVESKSDMICPSCSGSVIIVDEAKH